MSRKLIEAKPAHVAAAEQWAREFPARIEWQFAKPDTVTTSSGAAINVDDEGRIVVASEKQTEKDTYTIEVPLSTNTPVTALRLEALPPALVVRK